MSDKSSRGHSLLAALGTTALAFIMLISIACAAPYAYITNHDSQDVSVIDTATDTVTETVNVGSNPFELQSTRWVRRYM